MPNVDECTDKGFFSDKQKCSEVVPVHIKKDLSVFCQIYQNGNYALVKLFNRFLVNVVTSCGTKCGKCPSN